MRNAACWGTGLQAERSWVRFPMVFLEFGIDIWPWLQLSLLTEMSIRGIFWGVNAAGEKGWKPHHILVPIFSKSGSLDFLEPSGPLIDLHRDCFALRNCLNFSFIYTFTFVYTRHRPVFCLYRSTCSYFTLTEVKHFLFKKLKQRHIYILHCLIYSLFLIIPSMKLSPQREDLEVY